MRIAGLLTARNYSDSCCVFESLRPLVDIVIVLDDNSNEPFKHKSVADEYITLQNRSGWNDLGNRTTLMQRAFVHDCDWAVWSDDDIIYSHNFQTRDDVVRLISMMKQRSADVCAFVLRDLWDTSAQFRVDGIWGEKAFTVIQRNWCGDEGITLPHPKFRLHYPTYPTNKPQKRMLLNDHFAYHTGCFDENRRIARVEKYRREDPENSFQRDYRYMLNNSNLQVRSVPPDDFLIIERKFRAS